MVLDLDSKYVLENLDVTDNSSCVLVGDRKYDAIGAREVGIDSIGILWGHGSVEELSAESFAYLVASPDELVTELLS